MTEEQDPVPLRGGELQYIIDKRDDERFKRCCQPLKNLLFVDKVFKQMSIYEWTAEDYMEELRHFHDKAIASNLNIYEFPSSQVFLNDEVGFNKFCHRLSEIGNIYHACVKNLSCFLEELHRPAVTRPATATKGSEVPGRTTRTSKFEEGGERQQENRHQIGNMKKMCTRNCDPGHQELYENSPDCTTTSSTTVPSGEAKIPVEDFSFFLLDKLWSIMLVLQQLMARNCP